jgi:pimeloyl-ACP methyl ester carboxylesterase
VHAGFWQGYSSVRSAAIHALIQALGRHVLAANNPSPLRVYFTGHSLGGALAVLTAYEFQVNIDSILEVIAGLAPPSAVSSLRPQVAVQTFGTPRIGNPALAAALNARLRNYYRIEVESDLVPRLPRFLGLYQHAGVQVLADAEASGNLLVKPTIVESYLLRRSISSIADHTLNRYRDSLESCFEADELEEYLRGECTGMGAQQLNKASSASSSKNTPVPEWLLQSRR